jgi:hypothetical protein
MTLLFLCRPELVSGPINLDADVAKQILKDKQVQHDEQQEL